MFYSGWSRVILTYSNANRGVFSFRPVMLVALVWRGREFRQLRLINGEVDFTLKTRSSVLHMRQCVNRPPFLTI